MGRNFLIFPIHNQNRYTPVYFSNRQVIFKIDCISSQKENFLDDFRNWQIESKICQLFFSVWILVNARLLPGKLNLKLNRLTNNAEQNSEVLNWIKEEALCKEVAILQPPEKILTHKKFRGSLLISLTCGQISGSYLDWKYPKQSAHKTPQGSRLLMFELKVWIRAYF